ncbi:MAG: hypothetical protein CMD92_02710 [Gammaproteobacteria bacterium]|nr:hypothetical protein [Gammaproteobacteria bacterium]
MTEVLNKLNEVGVLCLKLTHKILQAEGPKPAQSPISEQVISSQIGQIRNLFKEIDIASLNLSEGEHREELMKYSAIQSFIAAFEKNEREAYARANLDLFGLQVDALHGGPTAKTLGGRKIGKKLSVQQHYLRAAALVLWTYYGKNNDEDCLNQLITDARTIIGVGTKEKLAKMVDNHDQDHDFDLTKSKSPLSVHIPGIEDLVKHHGYRRLKDFT